jgi:hemerythrin
MTDDPSLPDLPSTGRRDLDRVHWRVSGSLGSLWRALDGGTREEAIACAIGLLEGLRADYVGEESLMRRSAFPDLDRHVEAHAALEAGFNAIARRIRDAAPGFPPEERSALRRALSRVAGELAAHMSTADVALARFLDAGGVPETR